jgi:hypothetical protein
MGNDTLQWRATIGGFNGGGFQLVTGHDAKLESDARLALTTVSVALLLFSLLITCGSVHPNPGPQMKSFESKEENEIFNHIRSQESKYVRMQSHLDFLKVCIEKRIVPNGIDFRLNISAAFSHSKVNVDDVMFQSKLSLITSMAQHYRNQIPQIDHEINESYANLCNLTSQGRFQELEKDLLFMRKSVRERCKKTKIRKLSKLKKYNHQGHIENWIPNLNLKLKEKEILQSNGWLNDNIMDAASSILKRKFPIISGLDNVSFSIHGFVYIPTEAMQFHNLNNNHWILSSSIGGGIKVYDSMSSPPSAELKRQLCELYSPDDGQPSFKQVHGQQQVGSNDCGLFSIAHAIDLLEGNDITRIIYDQFQMRKHLITCLENNNLTPFPRKRISMDKKVSSDRFEGDWKGDTHARNKPRTSKFQGNFPLETKNRFEVLGDKTKEQNIERGKQEREDKRASTEKRNNKWKPGDLVLNLSSYELSPSEKEVLSLGIKFCPYPKKINIFNYFKDITAFSRKLRLKEFFVDDEKPRESVPNWIKNHKKSKFTPPKNCEVHLDSYLDLVASETMNMLKINSDEKYENMNESQRAALEKIMKNKDIIIKPADKGGLLVVMDKKDYEEAILEMLKDEKFYKEVKEDLNPGFEDDVENCINDMKREKVITDDEAAYLKNQEPQTPQFYGLPKVHKLFDLIPKFRPIVSGCNSVCERLSNFVDFHLQPLTRKLKSSTKDTTEFVKTVKDVQCKEETILVSADVSALYTVIDHDEGIEACREALEERSEQEKKKMPTNFITSLIKIILKSNCFSFLGRFFHQCTGTAMGTPMAPGYANLFMGMIEVKLLDEFERKTGLRPTVWRRFLDDIFFVWEDGEETLRDFMQHMQDFGKSNNLKTHLNFTFEQGNSVPFLDTMVSLGEGGKLKTLLFSKPTDAHLYLRKDSCHPSSCTKGLVKGELL